MPLLITQCQRVAETSLGWHWQHTRLLDLAPVGTGGSQGIPVGPGQASSLGNAAQLYFPWPYLC